MVSTAKYQVFVSSTYIDLHEEREAVVWKVLTARHIPVGMETFAASHDRGWATIQRVLDETDYYVLIIAGRYGYVDPATGKSWTQLEYEYARERGIPVLAFIRNKPAITADKMEDDAEKRQKLEAFIKTVADNHHRRMWGTKQELTGLVGDALSLAIKDDEGTERQRPGWFRGMSGPSVPEASSQADLDFDKLGAILGANSVNYTVTYTDGSTQPVHTTLLAVFEGLALYMQSETRGMNPQWAARAATVAITRDHVREVKEDAALDRAFRDVFADLAGYSLISAISSPQRGNTWYTLAPRGQDFFAHRRRVMLQARAATSDPQPLQGVEWLKDLGPRPDSPVIDLDAPEERRGDKEVCAEAVKVWTAKFPDEEATPTARISWESDSRAHITFMVGGSEAGYATMKVGADGMKQLSGPYRH